MHKFVRDSANLEKKIWSIFKLYSMQLNFSDSCVWKNRLSDHLLTCLSKSCSIVPIDKWAPHLSLFISGLFTGRLKHSHFILIFSSLMLIFSSSRANVPFEIVSYVFISPFGIGSTRIAYCSIVIFEWSIFIKIFGTGVRSSRA